MPPILATRARLTQSLRAIGFDVRRLAGELRWCPHASAPVEAALRQLKEAGVLVRYMNYAGWGDGLRITVGTDEQIGCLFGDVAVAGLNRTNRRQFVRRRAWPIDMRDAYPC